MVNIIGHGLFGFMVRDGTGGTGKIPGRLVVLTDTDDISVTDREPAITGWKGHTLLAVEMSGDSLRIATETLPEVDDGIKGLRVSGEKERTVYASGYLVSPMGLSGAFGRDGLEITCEADVEFEIEKV